jgi:hypothetical protein
LPICANPCDGLDDLCEDFTDEDCGRETYTKIIALLLGATIAFTIFVKLAQICIDYWQEPTQAVMNDPTRPSVTVHMNNLNRNLKVDDYKKMKNSKGFACSLANCFDNFKSTYSTTGAYEFSNYIYKLEKECNNGDSGATDKFYFNILGTDTTAKRFYDCLERSYGFEFEHFCISHSPAWLLRLMNKNALVNCFNCVMYGKKVMIHYLDIAKDFFLVWQIWVKIFGSNSSALFDSDANFPVVVFWVTIAAITCSELTNIVTLLHCDTFTHWSKGQKLLSCIFVPLMPALVYYKELEQKLKSASAMRDLRKEEIYIDQELYNYKAKHLHKYRKQIFKLQILRTQFKFNENVFEHFVQMIVLLLIIFNNRSATVKVTSLEKIILDNTDTFLIVSVIISCFSLLSGQVAYISAIKGNFLSLTGKIILCIYFTISRLTRVFVIILFYTPVLGLFNTNGHGIMGSINIDEMAGIWGDYRGSDKLVTFRQAWSNVTLAVPDLYSMPNYFSLLPPLLFLLHCGLSIFLLSRLYKKNKYPKLQIVLHGLYTILFPPLFVDWETIYRDSNGEVTIKKCWQKTKMFIFAQINIHFIEHILFCIPLVMLKVAIDQRNKDLTIAGFYPQKDELYSTRMVNDLLIAGLLVSLLLPFVQCVLIFLYFTKGHPWSRILNVNR